MPVDRDDLSVENIEDASGHVMLPAHVKSILIIAIPPLDQINAYEKRMTRASVRSIGVTGQY